MSKLQKVNDYDFHIVLPLNIYFSLFDVAKGGEEEARKQIVVCSMEWSDSGGT